MSHCCPGGVRRRASLAAGLACALAIGGVAAQRPARVRRIGFLTLRAAANEYDAAFVDAMRTLGYVEGRTLQIEYRWAAGSEQRAEALAAELVALEVEVIVAATTAAIRAAMRATRTIPIVMAASADPVIAGLVGSHARPEGNVTGVSMVSTDTATKRVQLVRELLPSATRIGVVMFGGSTPGPGEEGNALLVAQLHGATRALGLALSVAGIRSAADLAPAFAQLEKDGAEALIVQASAPTIDRRADVVALAERHRIAAIYETEAFVDAGGLLSYGPDLAGLYRRAALYVDRILKGAKPASLPIEQPDKLDLVVNLKAARALGLVVPRSLLLRAVRVIE